DAALDDAAAEDPAALDARGLGKLLYAGLTGRWPDGALHGLPAAPLEHGTLCSPRQVRAGVPTVLDEITTRALQERPVGALRTPAEVAEALAAVPRPRREPAAAEVTAHVTGPGG